MVTPNMTHCDTMTLTGRDHRLRVIERPAHRRVIVVRLVVGVWTDGVESACQVLVCY